MSEIIGLKVFYAVIFAPLIAALIWFIFSVVRRVKYRGDDTAERRKRNIWVILSGSILASFVAGYIVIMVFAQFSGELGHNCMNPDCGHGTAVVH